MRADVLRGSNDVNHRRLSRALAARSTSEAVGPERRQRPSSDLRRSPAPAKDRPSRATRLLASESTPRGDILALQPVHRSRWTACRRGSAAPPTMVLEENVRVIGSWWRLALGPPGGEGGVARTGGGCPTGDGHEIALGPHVVLRQLERRPSNSLRSTSSGRGNGATQCCRRCSCYRRPGRIDDLPTWFG